MSRFGSSTVSPFGQGKDPAPDQYTVHRQEGGFVVQHFPNGKATQPCCEVTVTKQDGESDVDALTRASNEIEAKHAPVRQSA